MFAHRVRSICRCLWQAQVGIQFWPLTELCEYWCLQHFVLPQKLSVYHCQFLNDDTLHPVCRASASNVSNWTKMEVQLDATSTNPNSRLQITTSQQGVIWFDQVSIMPMDEELVCVVHSTEKSMTICQALSYSSIWKKWFRRWNTISVQGFRNDLVKMLAQIKPKFLRFPGKIWVQIGIDFLHLKKTSWPFQTSWRTCI